MKAALFAISILVTVIGLIVWSGARDRAEYPRLQQEAVAHCKALGGEVLMTYGYRDSSYYVTGCKIGADR